MTADLPDFGKGRSDQAGSQDVSLPKLPALESQKLVGKNAEQLQALEDAVIQALRDQTRFGFELTSKNTDALVERLHTALEKLAVSNGVNFEALSEELGQAGASGPASVDD